MVAFIPPIAEVEGRHDQRITTALASEPNEDLARFRACHVRRDSDVGAVISPYTGHHLRDSLRGHWNVEYLEYEVPTSLWRDSNMNSSNT